MSAPWADVTAIVLAGGNASDPLAAAFGVPVKALVPLNGKPLAGYVLAALGACSGVARTVYVGPGSGLPGLPEAVLPGGASITDSLAQGLAAAERLEPGAPLLVVSADVPWLEPAALGRFIANAPDADVVYPAIPEHVAEAQFPGQRRTYAHLREGRFTGGNLLLLKPALAPRLLALLERAYAARKNPLALARLVGPDILLRLLLRRLSVLELEARVGRLLGGRARVYLSPDASLGADVDKLEQLERGPAFG